MSQAGWARSGTPDDMDAERSLAETNQTTAATDQVVAETDQVIAETDQTVADSDQTSADSDQTSADSDQSAADRDQAASDRDRAAGLSSDAYAVTREIRQHTTEQRQETGRARVEAANLRDEVARTRDLLAQARDQAAEARDQAMAQHDRAELRAASRPDFGVEILQRAAEQRRRAAEYRVLAAEHREQAAVDRRAAAADRAQAAAERRQAAIDREIMERELSMAETDPVTGARTRAIGLRDLDHELERCRVTSTPLVAVSVHVVGFKQLNDIAGPGVWNELLRQIAQLFAAHLRPHDLIIRVGTDAFVCAMPDVLEAFVRDRFSTIAAAFAATPHARGIRTGFATSRSGESAAELIARADADLVRHGHPGATG